MENGGPYRGPAGVGFSPKPLNFGVEAHVEAPLELLLPCLEGEGKKEFVNYNSVDNVNLGGKVTEFRNF
jgi:hypothetical protein